MTKSSKTRSVYPKYLKLVVNQEVKPLGQSEQVFAVNLGRIDEFHGLW